jgi:hypothetical protein
LKRSIGSWATGSSAVGSSPLKYLTSIFSAWKGKGNICKLFANA